MSLVWVTLLLFNSSVCVFDMCMEKGKNLDDDVDAVRIAAGKKKAAEK